MENDEKKYKEALEKARQLCGYPTTMPFISDLQDIFPELKESMTYKYFPNEFSSYEDYIKYLKEKGLALDVPERMYGKEEQQ